MSKRFFPFALAASESGSAPLLHAGAGDVPIDQQLADAFNANNAVLAYVNGIAKTTLPALPSGEPDWYRTFKTQFTQTKIHAMKWTNTIVPNLVGIPSGIADYAFTWNTTMFNINAAFDALRDNPKDQAAQQMIVNGLNRLVNGLSSFQGLVGDFGEEIKQFRDGITSDATLLQAASADAKKTAGYNRRQVEDLMNKIKELQDEVKKWQTVQTASAIAAGVVFFVGACVAIFTFGLGLAIGIIGAAAAITTMIVAGEKVKSLSGEIQVKQSQMSDLNKQIATLDTLVAALNDLVELAAAASEQMKLVMAAWNELGDELRAVITDLENAGGDASKLDLAGLRRDLNAANADWAKLRDFCLKIAGIQYLQATPATVNLPTLQSAAAA